MPLQARFAEWGKVSVVLVAAAVLLWVTFTMVRGLAPAHPLLPPISLQPAPTNPPPAMPSRSLSPGNAGPPQTGPGARGRTYPPGEPPGDVEDDNGPPPARAPQPASLGLPIQPMPTLPAPSLVAVPAIKP